MYSGEVVPYTNMGMISKLFEHVLSGFQMKGKLTKVGGIYHMNLLTEPRDGNEGTQKSYGLSRQKRS